MKLAMPKMKKPQSKEKFTIGLDCGTASVKYVKLRFFKDTVELCGAGCEASALDLVPVIRKLIPSQDTSQLAISVSPPGAIIRYVSFPRMDKEELSQALKFEAQKYIPFAISDVTLDSWILNADLPDNKMLVLMAAVKKEYLNGRLKLCESAGLKVHIVDIDSLALMNVFSSTYAQNEEMKGKAVALLNIGSSFSNLNIIDQLNPRLSRDIPIAGSAFTQKIAEVSGVEFKAAEETKRSLSDNKDDEIMRALEPVLANLSREVRVSFDYYESQNASSVTKILLSGGGSRLAGLKETLNGILSIEVAHWNPLEGLSASGDVDKEKVSQQSRELLVAYGLALRQQ